MDHEDIIAIADRLSRNVTVNDFVQKAYLWVRQYLEYAGFIAEDQGALSALKTRRGDCSEYAYLMAAISRAAGVPARVMGGFVIPHSALLKAAEYHNWTEVYVDGRWSVVDAQKGVLMRVTGDYLATRVVFRNGENNTTKFFHRFSTQRGRLEVEMD